MFPQQKFDLMRLDPYCRDEKHQHEDTKDGMPPALAHTNNKDSFSPCMECRQHEDWEEARK